MRRSAVVARFSIVAALAATLVGVGGAAGARAPDSASPPAAAKPIQSRNEIVAEIDAEKHLTDLSLPADAMRSAASPRGTTGRSPTHSPGHRPPRTSSMITAGGC